MIPTTVLCPNTSAWNASIGIPQNHGQTQHKNSVDTVLYVRYERFGEIWRHGFFFRSDSALSDYHKTFHKIFFKVPCYAEINCPAGVTVVVEEGNLMILVQTLDCCQNSQHKEAVNVKL